VVVLTKSDKLSRQQGTAAFRAVRAELTRLRPQDIDEVMMFSALNRSGRDELGAHVERWLRPVQVAGAVSA
jgi:GTP-binding protein EngB required for normal cell division